MTEQPMLSEADWAMILGLLQRELEELPTEIHHTTRADYRHDLHERRQRLEALVDKIQGAPVMHR